MITLPCVDEKYIYENLPMGHTLGNNFWEVKSTVSYRTMNKFIGEITGFYREYGEEALYSPFNEDFKYFTIEEGYSEPFPYRKRAGHDG